MHLLSSLIKSLILVVALFKDGKAIVTSSYIFIKVVLKIFLKDGHTFGVENFAIIHVEDF